MVEKPGKYQDIAANGGEKISGALLVIHGGRDPFVYPPTATDAVNKTVKINPSAQIEYHILLNISHDPVMYAGQMIWMDWIAARFAGTPVKPGYQSYVSRPVRPASAQLAETNSFIRLETESYQMT